MKVTVKSKSYGAKPVLGEISFDLAAGQRLAILGPSGIGKSTLLRIVAGLDAKFEGRVEGAGRIAMVFQEPTLLPWRTVLQNITLTTGCTPVRASKALADVGLKGREEDFPNQLSLGQQRRLAFARAIASAPDLMLMDEAFVSLDEATGQRMRDLAAKLLAEHGLNAVIVTHDVEEAAHLGDRVIGLGGAPARIVFDQVLDKSADHADQAAHIRGIQGDLGAAS